MHCDTAGDVMPRDHERDLERRSQGHAVCTLVITLSNEVTDSHGDVGRDLE